MKYIYKGFKILTLKVFFCETRTNSPISLRLGLAEIEEAEKEEEQKKG